MKEAWASRRVVRSTEAITPARTTNRFRPGSPIRSLLAVGEDEDRDHERDEQLHADLGVVHVGVHAFEHPDEEEPRDELGEDAVEHGGIHDSRVGPELHEEPAEQGGEPDEVQEDEDVAHNLHAHILTEAADRTPSG
jgi:hypothetical protein